MAELVDAASNFGELAEWKCSSLEHCKGVKAFKGSNPLLAASIHSHPLGEDRAKRPQGKRKKVLGDSMSAVEKAATTMVRPVGPTIPKRTKNSLSGYKRNGR